MRAAIALVCAVLFPACSPPDGQSHTAGTDGSSSSGGVSSDPEGSASLPTGGPSADSSGGGESTGDSSPVPYQEGSRLRAVLERSEAGDERRLWWHDTELGIDCFFSESADETYGCFPFNSWAPGHYADANCTVPAVPEDPCRETSEYGQLYSTACAAPAVLRRGTPVQSTFVRNQAGICTELDGSPGYRLDPIDAALFVQAVRSFRDIDDQLGRWELEADDGTTQWSGASASGVRCTPMNTESGAACLQSNFAVITEAHHQDNACSSANVATATVTGECAQPRFARDFHGNVFTITEELGLDEVWTGYEDTSCTPLAELNPTDSAFAYRQFEDSDAPTVQLRRNGGGRLLLQTPYTPDGTQLISPSHRWFDSELGIECVGRSDDAGQERCAPEDQRFIRFFSDAACTNVIITGRTSAQNDWLSLFANLNACGETRLLGAGIVGAPYAGPLYERETAGACTSVDTPDAYGPLRSLAVFHDVDSLASLRKIRP